jgi:hypothetical protein
MYSKIINKCKKSASAMYDTELLYKNLPDMATLWWLRTGNRGDPCRLSKMFANKFCKPIYTLCKKIQRISFRCTVFQTANTYLNISISTCPIATYISLDANSGIMLLVSNQSATSSDGALWLNTFDNKCFTVGIKWYVCGNRASAGIQCADTCFQ